jgi:hypothetical protein
LLGKRGSMGLIELRTFASPVTSITVPPAHWATSP